jgi:predicted GH43/DUF377 family glycosyl hydrolase
MNAFNWASIVHKGTRVTASRLDRVRPIRGQSSVRISADSASITHVIPKAEDPRFVVFRGDLYCYFTMPVGRRQYKVAISKLGADYKPSKPNVVWYGNPIEKNWCLFEHGKELYGIYDPSLFKIVMFSGLDVCAESITEPITWCHGRISGSTPPIRHRRKLVMFFHSWLRKSIWNGVRTGSRKRIYYLGCCELSNKPPFAVIRHSSSPLVLEESMRHRIIFPCGAERTRGGWKLACGLDDRKRATVFVSDVAVERSMDG